MPGGGKHLVIDRWHVGERVWPNVFGRESAYDLAMYRHTEMFLRSRGAVLVYTLRGDRERHLDELDEYEEPVHRENIAQVEALYQSALSDRYCNEWHYDFTRDDEGEFLSEFLAHARAEEDRAKVVTDITTEWVGNPKAKILLVGEQVGKGPGADTIPDAPPVPFAPYKFTSGNFLLNELLEGDWRDVAIVNAYKRDDSPEALVEVWAALGQPRVVTLGRIAQERTRVAFSHVRGFDFGAAPHPQWARRFKRAEGPGWYRNQVMEAAGRKPISL